MMLTNLQSQVKLATSLLYTYIFMSVLGGAILLAEAILLIYGVIKIRLILGKAGMAEQVNVGMFIVNAVAFFFQVCSICTWYVEFVIYTTTYYNLNCNSDDHQPVPPQFTCDKYKVKIRKTAITWWFCSNAANFIA